MSDKAVEMVTLTIDDVEVTVPKGTNLIEAAGQMGSEVPYYCYHKHLSVAGNCRMCQVELEGAPKLTIACNTGAQEGMVVRTQKTSKKVEDAQRATLEFLLINHPLDCTVCDQAGHCKLQDYYYEYNRTPSRFIEKKEHKPKAEIFGPNVVYDGERCIVCTRCVRFCDEVTETSELGVFNRGDRTLIGIHPDKELDNPLAGSVVDLCPVGALTHRKWRFNTRIWNTVEKDTICTGCSTGCNVKVAVRDGEVVQVKGRLNSDVNQEWLCDEGRYGFDRFQPEVRSATAYVREEGNLLEAELNDALEAAASLKQAADSTEVAVFLSPHLTLEEVWSGLCFADKVMGVASDSDSLAMQVWTRELSSVEQVLVSPDYAPNARAMSLFGVGIDEPDWRSALAGRYTALLSKVRSGNVKRLLLIGDGAIRDEDVDDSLVKSLLEIDTSVALSPKGILTGELGEKEQALGAHQLCQVILPSRTVNEKNGVMLNRDMRFQRLQALLTAPTGAFAEWDLLKRIAKLAKVTLLPDSVTDERSLFREMVKGYSPLVGLSLARIGEWGISWDEFKKLQMEASSPNERPSA